MFSRLRDSVLMFNSLRASGLKATSAEAYGRAIRTTSRSSDGWRHGGHFGAVSPRIPACDPKTRNLSPNEECGRHFGAMSLQITTCAPKREMWPPSEDCAPKKVAGSMPLDCSSGPQIPKILVINPVFVGKNCFSQISR